MSVLNPLYHALAAVLAFFYALIPDYAAAIALLTVAVMLVLAPLTVKSTRSMMAMQALQPEMKKLQAKYKNDRQKLNEELMALYKENGINPAGGCIPMFMQLPVFFVLYRVIANLTHTTKTAHPQLCPTTHQMTTVCPTPQNVGHNTELYHNLVASNGQMHSLGINLSLSVHNAHGASVVIYALLVIVVAGIQYVQTRQLNGRNPAAAANPQAKMMQRIMPLFFLIISISIAAALNVYFLVSGLFRVAQQELMWRHDPVLQRHAAARPTVVDAPSRPSGQNPKGADRPGSGRSPGNRPGGPRQVGTGGGDKSSGTAKPPAGNAKSGAGNGKAAGGGSKPGNEAQPAAGGLGGALSRFLGLSPQAGEDRRAAGASGKSGNGAAPAAGGLGGALSRFLGLPQGDTASTQGRPKPSSPSSRNPNGPSAANKPGGKASPPKPGGRSPSTGDGATNANRKRNNRPRGKRSRRSR